MTVRPATCDDLPAIASIHVRAWQASYRGILPDARLDGLDVAEREARWWQWFGVPGSRVLVAADDGVRGFVRTHPLVEERTVELSHLYLDPDAIGTGIGRSLLGAAVDLARDDGHHVVVLWTLEANQRARRFYERAGFATDGGRRTDPAFLGNDAPSVRYRRTLK